MRPEALAFDSSWVLDVGVSISASSKKVEYQKKSVRVVG